MAMGGIKSITNESSFVRKKCVNGCGEDIEKPTMVSLTYTVEVGFFSSRDSDGLVRGPSRNAIRTINIIVGDGITSRNITNTMINLEQPIECSSAYGVNAENLLEIVMNGGRSVIGEGHKNRMKIELLCKACKSLSSLEKIG